MNEVVSEINEYFIYIYLIVLDEREPSKRKIKPPSQPLLDLEFGESSDDSDFNIDDIHQGSDDDSFITEDENGKILYYFHSKF